MYLKRNARDWRVIWAAMALCAGLWCATPRSAAAFALPDRPPAGGIVKGDPDGPYERPSQAWGQGAARTQEPRITSRAIAASQGRNSVGASFRQFLMLLQRYLSGLLNG